MTNRSKHILLSCISRMPVVMAVIIAVVCATLCRYHHHEADGSICICAIEHIADNDSNTSHHPDMPHGKCEHHPEGTHQCPTIESGGATWYEAPRDNVILPSPVISDSDICAAYCISGTALYSPVSEPAASYGHTESTLPSIAVSHSHLRAPPSPTHA